MTIVPLQNLDPHGGSPYAVSDDLRVTGRANAGAFHWHDGAFTIVLNESWSIGMDVAADGGVAGYRVDTTTWNSQPFRWKDGVLEFLPVLGFESEAYTTDSSGRVAGHAQDWTWCDRVVLWDEMHQPTLLPSLGATCPDDQASRMNEAGQIVGWSTIPAGWDRAALWQNGTVTNLAADLPDHSFSVAWDINNAGQAVGYWETHGPPYSWYAMLWEGDVSTTLPGLSPSTYSEAIGISDGGTVIGWVWDTPLGYYGDPVRWRKECGGWTVEPLYDAFVAETGWTIWDVIGITACGVILAEGSHPTHPERYVFIFDDESSLTLAERSALAEGSPSHVGGGCVPGTIEVADVAFDVAPSDPWDGLDVRVNRDEDICHIWPLVPVPPQTTPGNCPDGRGEWVTGTRNQGAALTIGPVCNPASGQWPDSSRVKLKARFRVPPGTVTSARFSAYSATFGVFAEVHVTEFDPVTGLSDWVEFHSAPGSRPTTIQRLSDTLMWSVRDINETPTPLELLNCTGPHPIYFVLGPGTAPMTDPWTRALDHATVWAHGQNNEMSAAAVVVNKIYFGIGLDYDPALPRWGGQNHLSLTTFLDYLDGVPGTYPPAGDCNDFAHFVIALGNSLGANRLAQIKTGPGQGDYVHHNYIDGAGTTAPKNDSDASPQDKPWDSSKERGFRFHAVVFLSKHLGLLDYSATDPVFDASNRVDFQPEPQWADEKSSFDWTVIAGNVAYGSPPGESPNCNPQPKPPTTSWLDRFLDDCDNPVPIWTQVLHPFGVD